MKPGTLCILLTLTLLALPVASAQTGSAADAKATQPPAAPSASATTEGEVRKVDKDAGKITLKHGSIPNLDMPAMTMVFRVRDASMLDKVKPGDKVRFGAEKIGGTLTIMKIEPVR
jgi:Cu/Ag efflux protein CusF